VVEGAYHYLQAAVEVISVGVTSDGSHRWTGVGSRTGMIHVSSVHVTIQQSLREPLEAVAPYVIRLITNSRVTMIGPEGPNGLISAKFV
jgi:hypothetical protein